MSTYLKGIVIALTFICCQFNVKSQSDYKAIENDLNHLFKSFFAQTPTNHPDTVNKKIRERFGDFFSLDSSFYHSFENVDYVNNLISDDKKLSVITYPTTTEAGVYSFCGYIRIKSDTGIHTYSLTDMSDSLDKPENMTLPPAKWYGAFYYEILTNTTDKNTFYTLLGWDGNTPLSNKKVIDILTLNQQNEPVFGKPVISHKEGRKHRLIFEFNEQATMTLRYDKRKDMIIFDHLSPSKPQYKGNYKYYGPDFTQDGLKFENGVWRLISDVEVENPQ